MSAEKKTSSAISASDRSDSTDVDFSKAVEDVVPLKDASRSGRIARRHDGETGISPGPPSKRVLAESRFEIELESDGPFTIRRRDLDMKTIRTLKSGAMAIEDKIDLHGYTIEKARIAVRRCIEDGITHHRRCVLIIFGKGKGSFGGKSVLRDEVIDELTHDPLAKYVLAFVSARRDEGSYGAGYVLLKKQRSHSNQE